MSVPSARNLRTPEGYRQARQIAETELAAAQSLVEDPANNLTLDRSQRPEEHAHARDQLALILGMQNALILGSPTIWMNSTGQEFAYRPHPYGP